MIINIAKDIVIKGVRGLRGEGKPHQDLAWSLQINPAADTKLQQCSIYTFKNHIQRTRADKEICGTNRCLD